MGNGINKQDYWENYKNKVDNYLNNQLENYREMYNNDKCCN